MEQPRKRQKIASEGENQSGPNIKLKAPAKKQPAKSTKKPEPQEWPQVFKDLQQVFKAVNLVYTFCCTRKHFATTFANLKSAVESHIKRPLVVEDISRIKTLLPNSIHFTYVDEDLLEVNVMAGSSSKKDKEWEELYSGTGNKTTPGGSTKGKEVLYFEFTDGDLKAKHGKKTENIKLPTYSPAQMTKIITKRNEKFDDAVNQFIKECIEAKIDPVLELDESHVRHIPVQTKLVTTDDKLGLELPKDIPKDRKSIKDIIEEIKRSEIYSEQIVPDGHIITPPQEAKYGDLKFRLSQGLVNALYNARGITKFYSHQANAMNALHEGNHVIVSTSTSSGKSLIYQVPVLHQLERHGDTRAMYIFPTKALAQDQKRSLKEVLHFMQESIPNVLVETFDGDTPMDDRRRIREEARVIFTNPDMLHIAILPNESYWRTFLKNLKYVVVDELHVYNGLFGAHVAFIMRRLRRVCASLGNRHVKFISCSATISDPAAHMKSIFGIDEVVSIEQDGSPSGQKEFLCWNSPYRDPEDPSLGRVEVVGEGARILAQLVLRGARTIAFCKVRKHCEMLISAVRLELQKLERNDAAELVMAYRGGYTPEDRRKIEKEMFEGRLLGIVATNALELGVDIGTLDAVIIVGFPFTIANLRQQSGRAGRRNKDSLSVLVGDTFALDQHYMQNPKEIFTRKTEDLQIDLENNLVLEGHLQCAAYEMPINIPEDTKFFGPSLAPYAKAHLVRDDLDYYHMHPRFRPRPSDFVKIRDTEDDHINVVDITNGRNKILELVEPSRAIFTLYEGGIFMHQGYPYLITSFTPHSNLATVSLVKVDWTTSPRDYTDVDPLETELIQHLSGTPVKAYFGKIQIRAVVFGFFKIDRQKRILDACETDTHPFTILSKGLWIDIPPCALKLLSGKRINLAASIHAAQHALLSLIPRFVVSALGEVRTECKSPQKEFMKRETSRKRPARLTIYDSKGGASGSGICLRVLGHIESLLRDAVKRIESCDCEVGCPACVASERCKEANVVISKVGALVVLRRILNLEVDEESIPMGPELYAPEGIETIVPAEEVKMAQSGKVVKIESD